MGNRRRIPEQLLRLILMRISMGYGDQTIAREVGVNRKTVRSLRINLEIYGEFYPPSPHVIGRPRILSVAEELAVVEVIAHQPTIYVDEIQDHLLEVFDVRPSISTLWRTIHRYNLTRKIVDKHVKERSEALRAVWRARQKTWLPEQLVALDDSLLWCTQ
ncbi:hypothetical protein DM02DRAFT_665516 [Periconia macrospinosa]|uniref:Transposase Tc1-like domain-containing protein n=1 Tax=Periconia macrospinosa TaxID=97972 RepID=A0A2V1CWS5_9PLEO|nr:hypothetical protein DM02DRAFT_665516 [Periconia macrospinosa]